MPATETRNVCNETTVLMEELLNKPQLKVVFNKILDKRMVQERGKLLGEYSVLPPIMNENNNFNATGMVKTPDLQKRKSIVENAYNSNFQHNMIKLPSDTTIYAPALYRMNTPEKIADNLGSKIALTPPGIIDETNNLTIQDKITDFVESVRRQQTQMGNQVVNQGTSTSQGQVQSVVNVPGQDKARNKTANAILEAEKFSAAVVKLAGTQILVDNDGQGQQVVVDENVLPVFQQ